MPEDDFVPYKRETRPEAEKRWSEHGAKHLVGRTIVRVEYMDDEMRDGWDKSPPMLVLDDGTLLYPARDEAMNEPACLAGIGPKPDYEDLRFPRID
jgi:hypothetical protein